MKSYSPIGPTRRDLTDPRSTGPAPAQTRKPFLNDRRSGR